MLSIKVNYLRNAIEFIVVRQANSPVDDDFAECLAAEMYNSSWPQVIACQHVTTRKSTGLSCDWLSGVPSSWV